MRRDLDGTWYYDSAPEDEWQGVRCVCGQLAVGLHQSCRSMMTQEEIDRWERGK